MARPDSAAAPRDFHLEGLDEDMARVLAAKTGAERLAIAEGLFISAREMLRCHLTSAHPDWSEDEVNNETVRRLSHGAIGHTR
jgi:hypothetical protein